MNYSLEDPGYRTKSITRPNKFKFGRQLLPFFSSPLPSPLRSLFSSSPVFFRSYSFQGNPNKEFPAQEATFLYAFNFFTQ